MYDPELKYVRFKVTHLNGTRLLRKMKLPVPLIGGTSMYFVNRLLKWGICPQEVPTLGAKKNAGCGNLQTCELEPRERITTQPLKRTA